MNARKQNPQLKNLGDDFDEVDFAVSEGDDPDGVTLENGARSEHFQRRSSIATKRQPQSNTPRPPSPSVLAHQALPRNGVQTPANSTRNGPSQGLQPIRPASVFANTASSLEGAAEQPSKTITNADSSSNVKSSDSSTHEAPVGFYTARAAESLQRAPGGMAPQAPAFNPHLDSPSIRKTAGIDHSQTKPVNRTIVSAPVTTAPQPQSRGPHATNPQADKTRKVGMPNLASPLQNRGSYKPPQMKRPVDGGPVGRSALGDVTNASVNASAGGDNMDVKRQRFGTAEPGSDTITLNA